MKRLLPLVLVAFTSCVAAVDDPSERGFGGSTEIVTGSGGSTVVPGGTGGSVFGGTGGGIQPGTGGSIGTGGASVGGTGGRVGSGGTNAPDAGAPGTDARPDGAATDVRPAGTGGAAGRPGTGGATSTGGVTGTGGRPAGTGGTTATVCTSNVQWNGSTGPNMRPGSSCRGCHSYPVSGTVYPTLHEPTNCNGTNASGLRVVITGSNGTVLTLTPNSAGNFFSNTAPSTPFRVTITSSAGTRMMNTPQTNGDCNSCHTQNGSANGAPGRVMAP